MKVARQFTAWNVLEKAFLSRRGLSDLSRRDNRTQPGVLTHKRQDKHAPGSVGVTVPLSQRAGPSQTTRPELFA
jgi:hypothetical protein